ncbi:MAG: four helix bundle protein [Ferruginibacter sp.]
MGTIKSYRDLIIWQKSVALVTNIYDVTGGFPSSEIYGLTNQLRRCAVSIPSNIAEGYGRNSTGDYKRFLQIAVGSLYELQTQIEIAFNLAYILKEQYNGLISLSTEIDKMIYSIIQKLK